MYGYIIPDKMNMFMKDFYLYRAYYCGLCKCIGKEYGELMRFSTNYDMTFLSLMLHGVKGVTPEFSNETCVLNPIRKKTVAKSTELMRQIAEVNVLLLYYKLEDDERDKGKAALKKFVKKHYRKAARKYRDLNAVYSEQYAKLNELESKRTPIPDEAAEPFSIMMRKTAETLFSSDYTEEIGGLFYNLGKFVYIMDALDDLEDDYKSGNYNPFLIDYEFMGRSEFNSQKGDTARLILMNTYDRIKECYKSIALKENEGAVTNILWYGILERINAILKAEGKLPRVKV